MSREEVEKLLGGYATGTLTAEERDALFAAALQDQELFEALAREEPLREILQDPIAKGRLQAALRRKPEAKYWRWLRPATWAIPAAGLAAIIVMFVVERPKPRPVMIAQAPALPHLDAVEPIPAPLPKSLELPRQARRAEARPVEPPPAGARVSRAEPPRNAPAQGVVGGVLTDQVLTATAPAPPPPAPAVPPPAEKESTPPRLQSANQVVIVEAPLAQQGQQGQQAQGQQGGQTVRSGVAPLSQFGLVSGVGGISPTADARTLFFGQANAALVQTSLLPAERKKGSAREAAPRAAAPPMLRPLGLRYSILRRLPNGESAAVIPNEVLDAGDQISLRLESNDAGYLSVFERAGDGWRQIDDNRIELGPYTVPASGTLGLDGPPPKELFVVFSRQARQTPYPVGEARLDQVMSTNLEERLTYVVSTSAATQTQTVAFPITLAHK